MAKKRTYFDIGHGGIYVVWLWTIEGLEVAYNITHEQAWGQETINCWRGRFDKDSQTLSIVAPGTDMGKFRVPPEDLLEALSNRFGDDTEVVYFNRPQKRRMNR